MADIKLRLVLQDGQRVTATLDVANTLLATMLANAEKVNRAFTGGLSQVKERIEQLLQQPLEEVQVTLLEVAEAKEILDAALLSAASQESRAEIIKLQRAVNGLEKDLLGAASSAGSVGQALGGAPASGANKLSKRLNTLNQSAFQVGQAFEDFLIAGARGAANNINFLIAQYAALGGVLGIAVGTIASLGISIGTATGFFDDLFASLSSGVDNIDEVKQKLQSLVDFDFSLGVTINEENIQQVTQNINALVKERERLLESTKEQLRLVSLELQANADIARTGGFNEEIKEENKQLNAQRVSLTGLLSIRQQSLNDARAELEIIKDQRAEIEANARRQRDLEEAGADVNVDVEEEERLQKERERKAKELARLRLQLESQVRQAQIQAIEDQEERAIEAVRNEFQERINLAGQVGDSSAAIELERLLGVRIAQIRADFREKELQKETQFQERLEDIRTQQLVIEGADESEIVRERIATLSELLEAETENTDRRKELRLDLAEAELELTRILQRQADEQARVTERQTSEAQRFADAYIQAQEQVALANGIPILDILSARQKAIEAQLESTALTIERRRQLELDLLETLADISSEELAIQEQRAQQLAQFLNQFADAIEDAFDFEPSISEDEIRNQRNIFRTTEQDLRDSLERREVSQAQFVARMNELDRQRADFFREVQEDQLSVAERSAAAIAGILQEATKRAVVNKISEAIANQITFSSGKVPLPALLAIGAAAYASLRAFQNKILGDSQFRGGGYTGGGNPEDVAGAVHKGEYVFTSTSTSGQVKALDRLQKMMKRGLNLDDILNAYNDYSGIIAKGLPSSAIVPRRLGPDQMPVGGRVGAAHLIPSLEKVVRGQEMGARELSHMRRSLEGIESEMSGLRKAIGTYSWQAFNDGFDKPKMYENIERMAGAIEKTIGSSSFKKAIKRL